MGTGVSENKGASTETLQGRACGFENDKQRHINRDLSGSITFLIEEWRWTDLEVGRNGGNGER